MVLWGREAAAGGGKLRRANARMASAAVPTFDSFPSPPPSAEDPHRERAPASQEKKKKKRKTRTTTKEPGRAATTKKNTRDQAEQFLNALREQIEQPQQEHQPGSKRSRRTSNDRPRTGIPAKEHKNAPEPKQPLFTLDLREDTFALHHARPDKAKVPRYRRAAAGQVLGIHPSLRITFASACRGDGLQLSRQTRHKPISIADPAVLQLLKDKNLKRISLAKPASAGSVRTAVEEPFIPLVDSGKPSQPVDRPLGINLHGEPESDADGLEDCLPPEQDGGESFLDQLNHRKGELERRTAQHPEDVEAWLALVSLQDEMKELGLVGLRARGTDVDQEAISRHGQGTSDLKIAYLKRALREPSNQDNEKLLLAYMKAYCDQPDLDLAKEWQQILEAHPAVTGLWIAYVDWKQTEAGSMNVLEMVEVYEELIDRLVRRAEDPNTPGKERTLFEQSIVYLFHRCCVMLKQAGYTERATAAFQAIIELNFLRPPQKLGPLNELVDDFEAFWDSELPRLGEHGAKGWMNMDLESSETLDQPQLAHALPDQATEQAPQDTTDTIFSAWHAQEMKAHPPLRTADLQDDQDPFGCVLFDDIRNLLFLLSTDESLQALLYSFLSFVGVAIPPPDIDTNVPFFTDPFLSTELIDVPERQSAFWPQLDSKLSFDPYGPTERLSGIKQPQMIPLRIFPCDIRQLFADPARWFVHFEPPMDSVGFIRNAFQALRTTRALKQDTYFQLCELSFEARVDVSAAIRLAKHSLSLDQRNLVLWDAYARLCLLRGKPKQARDVYVKTLEMSERGTEGLLSLWFSWAEMEFQLGHSRLVIGIFARAMDCLDESPSELVRNTSQSRSPALLLRVRRAFTGHLVGSFQDDLPLSLLRCRVSAAAGFGTFQHLTEGFPAGCDAYERSIQALAELDSPAEEEELWLNYSRLLYQQIQAHQRFQPAAIRAVLHRAIGRFPNNSVFLALFAFNEAKMRIENQTRRLLDAVVLKQPVSVSVNRWLVAVWVELHLSSSSYNLPAVRGLFERALTHQSIRSCVQLWLLYIQLEVRNGHFDRAWSLVTRALAHCPWAKELYMVPFTHTFAEGKPAAGRSTELARMARLVDEKCVRIRDRPGLRRLLSATPALVPAPVDGVDDMEEAREFEERRKLLPY